MIRRHQVALVVLLLISSTELISAAPFVPERNAQCVAFSPDGKFAATGVSGLSNSEFPPRSHPSPRKSAVVNIWDVESGKLLRRMHTFGDLTKVRFSNDGKLIAASRLFATTDGLQLNAVLMWNTADGSLVNEFDRCQAFDFSPDSKTIAVLSRTHCVLFDTATLQRIREIEPLEFSISLNFSPDGESIAGITPDDGHYRIRICATKSGRQISETPPLPDAFYSFAFSPDGRRIASGFRAGNVLIWDVATMSAIGTFQSGGAGLLRPFFSPDGTLLGAGDQQNGDVVFWSLESRKEVARYTFQRGEFRTYFRREDDDKERPETDPERFTFSPDSKAFFAGCYGGMIRMVADGRDVRQFAN